MDTSILKADIFFVVATVGIGAIFLAIIVALIYIIYILKDVKALSTKAKEEGDKILEDVRLLREQTENKTSFVLNLVSTFLSFGAKKSKSRGGKRKQEEDEEF